jgi:hypothetical protein
MAIQLVSLPAIYRRIESWLLSSTRVEPLLRTVTPERRSQTAREPRKGVASAPPTISGVSAEEWRVLATARPNLLLVGDAVVTSKILRALRPMLQEPVWVTAAAPLSLPSSSQGTLVVQDGASLAAADQARLLQWLSDHQPGVQLVTTTPTPLLPFVLRGAFLDTLYYCLNVMYVEL